MIPLPGAFRGSKNIPIMHRETLPPSLHAVALGQARPKGETKMTNHERTVLDRAIADLEYIVTFMIKDDEENNYVILALQEAQYILNRKLNGEIE